MFGNRACREIESLLWNYAARRVSEEDIERVESHLKACAKCREQADGYRQTLSALTAYQAQPAPASRTNWQDLRMRLAETSPAPAPVGFRWKMPVMALGSLAAAALLLIVINPFRPTAAPGTAFVGPADSTPGPKNTAANTEKTVPSLKSGDGIVWTDPPKNEKHVADTGSSNDTLRYSAPDSRLTTVARREPRLRTHHRYYNTPRMQSPTPDSQPDIQLVSASDVDGGRPSAKAPQENYVISPVGYTTGQEDGPNYVMGSVAPRGNGASNIEEAKGW